MQKILVKGAVSVKINSLPKYEPKHYISIRIFSYRNVESKMN